MQALFAGLALYSWTGLTGLPAGMTEPLSPSSELERGLLDAGVGSVRPNWAVGWGSGRAVVLFFCFGGVMGTGLSDVPFT